MTLLERVQALLPSASASLVDMYYDMVKGAEKCLERHGDADYVQTMIALAIAHLILAGQQDGELSSERTRTGAAATYAVKSGSGINSTRFGRQLLGFVGSSCLTNIIAPKRRFAHSIAPRWDC